MATELARILDVSLGVDWGRFSADFITPIGNEKEIELPQIVYDYSARSPNNTIPKPTLFDTIEEVVDGKKTGDAFRIWRQWFDYDFVVDIFHIDSIKARSLMKVFEGIFEMSKAQLKQMGVQKIRFAGEVDPRNSIRYREDTKSRCLVYEVVLEKIVVERLSTLQSINTITKQ